MASWITHLRIADRLIDIMEGLPYTHFVVGNVAPDSGQPVGEGNEYEPPTYISHWKQKNVPQSEGAEKFKETYLIYNQNIYATAFYLGYYVHLLTDYIWVRDVYPLLEIKLGISFDKDLDLMKKVKRDMYEIDCIFLKESLDFYAFSVLMKIDEFPNLYLEYFSKDAIEKKVLYIRQFYDGFVDEKIGEHNYISQEIVDDFIRKAENEIRYRLNFLGRMSYDIGETNRRN